MKNGRKIFSIILAICMVMQILPVFAAEEDAAAVTSGINYVINDDFTEELPDTWEIKNKLDNATLDVVKTAGVDGNEENYALEFYSPGGRNVNAENNTQYLSRELSGGEGISYEDGKNIVIKTAFKYNDDATTDTGRPGRLFFKFNINDETQAQVYCSDGTTKKKERGLNINTLLFVHNSGNYTSAIQVPVNPATFDGNGAVTFTPTDSDNHVNVLNSDKWTEAEITIKGTSNKADYKVTYNGVTATGTMDLTQRECNVVATGEAFDPVGTALTNLAYCFRDGDDTLYVDYLRVYEEYSAVLSVNEVYKAGSAIEVVIDTAEGSESFKDAIAIYDEAGNIVPATNTIDETNKVVTVTPDTAITAGKYTVKADLGHIPANYVFSNTEAAFLVGEKNYIVYDNFNEETPDTWEIKNPLENSALGTEKITGVDGDAENYALKFCTGASNGENNTQYLSRELNGGAGISYEDAKNIVIKTAFKYNDAAATPAGRLFFKFNINDETQAEVYCVNGSTKKRERGLGINSLLFVHNSGNYTSAIQVPSNPIVFDANGGVTFTPTDSTNHINVLNSDKWTEAEITIKGTSNKADYKVTYNGVTATGTMDLTQRECNVVSTGKAFDPVGTALTNLAYCFRNGDNTLYVDYLKVYEEYSADLYVDEVYKAGAPIDVKIDALNVDESFKDAFSIYSGDTKLASTNSIDETNKVVTITPVTPITAGKYTVKVDTSLITGDYLFTKTEADFEVGTKRYIISDDFASGDTEGWVAKAYGSVTHSLEAKENTDGYYLEYGVTAGDAYSYIEKELSSPITFTEDKDIVIETKLLQTESGSRSFLKFNMQDTYDADEREFNYGTLIFNSKGSVCVLNGWGTSTGYGNEVKLVESGATNVWYDVKITIHGNTKTASYVLTDESGNEYSKGNMSFDYPEGLDYTDGNGVHHDGLTWVEDVINTFNFRLRGAQTLKIDYFRVYEALPQATAAIDAVNVASNASVGAHLIGTDGEIADFSDAVALYDADGNEVSVTKSFVKEAKAPLDTKRDVKVVLTPNDDLKVGNTYTVRYDKSEIEALCDIEVTGNSEFTFNVISSTDVKETFEDSDISAWTFREGSTAETMDADVIEENGNKFLRVTVDGAVERGDGKIVTYEKAFASPFVRDMESSTVVEMKLRTNQNVARKYVKLNYPTSGSKNTNAYNEYSWNTRLAAVMNKGNLATVYRDFYFNNDETDYGNRMQGNAENVAAYETGKWYTVKTVYNNVEGTATTYVYDEAGALVEYNAEYTENNALSAWWFNYADYDRTQPQIMHTIDSITLQFRPESGTTSLSNEQLDIDDIKIYNINTTVEEIKAILTVDGEEIEALTPNTTVKPMFTLQPEGKKETTYYAISVIYVDGVMDDVHINPITTTGEVFTETDGYVLGDDITGVTIKAFVWDSLTGMKPLCAAAEAEGH